MAEGRGLKASGPGERCATLKTKTRELLYLLFLRHGSLPSEVVRLHRLEAEKRHCTQVGTGDMLFPPAFGSKIWMVDTEHMIGQVMEIFQCVDTLFRVF